MWQSALIRRRLRILLLGAATLALAGCGLSSSAAPAHVSLLVTRGFGAQTLAVANAPRTVARETLARLLAGSATATTGRDGRIASIDGHAGSWLVFENGVEVYRPPARARLHSGDHIWWDLHDARATARVPAVVGAFPEPFVDGFGGKRLPLRIECTQPRGGPCRHVEDAFAALGLVASLGCLECSQYNLSLRVLVGPYAALRSDPAAVKLEGAPTRSGVYARFADAGHRLVLLDARGRAVRSAGAGAGLVAAARYMGQPPVWLVTGTDDAGVAAAEQAFNAQTLDGHFAVAVVADAAIPLPVPGR